MSRRKKRAAEQDREDAQQGTVVLEFFDERDGRGQFTMELSQEDFARYEQIAASKGVPIEELMAEIAEREIEDRNSYWVLPKVDSFGRLDLANGTPMDFSNLTGRKDS